MKDPLKEIGESMRSKAVEAVCNQWEAGLIFESTWRGVICAKNPCDAWVYQELIGKIKPEIIVETGSFKGGSALMLLDFMDMAFGNTGINGEVISVDLTNYAKPKNPRITWITDNSTGDMAKSYIIGAAKGKKTLIILDSDHSAAHVLDEMNLYAKLVTPGSYLIVEDTWVNAGNGKGPWPAVEQFMAENPGMFEIDRVQERYLMTNNPKGFLRRL